MHYIHIAIRMRLRVYIRISARLPPSRRSSDAIALHARGRCGRVLASAPAPEPAASRRNPSCHPLLRARIHVDDGRSELPHWRQFLIKLGKVQVSVAGAAGTRDLARHARRQARPRGSRHTTRLPSAVGRRRAVVCVGPPPLRLSQAGGCLGPRQPPRHKVVAELGPRDGARCVRVELAEDESGANLGR
eukprot:scaffold26561_cov129-Isochrysis_galbana.AAC.2